MDEIESSWETEMVLRPPQHLEYAVLQPHRCRWGICPTGQGRYCARAHLSTCKVASFIVSFTAVQVQRPFGARGRGRVLLPRPLQHPPLPSVGHTTQQTPLIRHPVSTAQQILAKEMTRSPTRGNRSRSPSRVTAVSIDALAMIKRRRAL